MTDEELELFPTSESANRMLSYVTAGFYDKSYVGKWMFQVMGLEYDTAKTYLEELPDQFFIETATWGLKYHEIKWQLPVRENLSYEERRRLIYQKRDYRAPMSPVTMETYLKNALGDFEVYVCDIHDAGPYGYVPEHPNVFKVYFVGDETLDTQKVYKMIDKLKQSHTTYKINDRMEIVIDNSDLEEIRLVNVKSHFTIPFWGCRVFDGSWLLDGSVGMGAERRYSLVLGLKYGLGGIVSQEKIKLISPAFLMPLHTQEYIKATVNYHFGLNFWNVRRFFDGGWNLDGSVLLDNVRRYGVLTGMKYRAEIIEHETVDNLTVETKSKDYWFLDGTYTFDGSRNLNSIYRKEAAE